MDGFLLIDKQTEMTSFDVVYKIKKKFHIDKIGHTGTLDPFASGLLILCLGRATKLAHLFSNSDKSYEGTIIFGKHYDTYDTTGNVIHEDDVMIYEDNLKKAMDSCVGTYDQIPPMYSAIKMDGQRLYQLARSGQEIKREARSVHIHTFDLLERIDSKRFSFFASVSKGTYVRSLAVDLAAKLSTYGALEALKRVSIGKYHLKDAKTIDETTEHDIMRLESFFECYPTITLNDYMIKLVKNGVYLDDRQLVTDQPFIVLNEKNEKIAYYEVIGKNTYKPILIF